MYSCTYLYRSRNRPQDCNITNGAAFMLISYGWCFKDLNTNCCGTLWLTLTTLCRCFVHLLWPFFIILAAHLKKVTSQVVCLMSIYKTTVCERQRARAWQLCQHRLWSIYLWTELEREGGTEGSDRGWHDVMNSHNPQLVIWQLERCDVTLRINNHHAIHPSLSVHTLFDIVEVVLVVQSTIKFKVQSLWKLVFYSLVRSVLLLSFIFLN